MKLVVFGSRRLDPRPRFIDECVFLRWGVLPSLVISGTARGADRAGEEWALWRGIPLKRMPADWESKGHRAGFIRNAEMAAIADWGLGFWDGRSNGTRHMADTLRRLSKSLELVTP